MSQFRNNIMASTKLAHKSSNIMYTPVSGMHFEHDMLALNKTTGKWVAVKKDTIDTSDFNENYVTNGDVIIGEVANGHLHAVGIRPTMPVVTNNIWDNPIKSGTVYGKGDKIYSMYNMSYLTNYNYYRLEFILDVNGMIKYGGGFNYLAKTTSSNTTTNITWSAGDSLQVVLDQFVTKDYFDWYLVDEITMYASVVDGVTITEPDQSTPKITMPACIGFRLGGGYSNAFTLSNVTDANGNTLTPTSAHNEVDYGILKLIDMSKYTTFDENNDISANDIFEWSVTTEQNNMVWRNKYKYLWEYVNDAGSETTHRYWRTYNPRYTGCVGPTLYNTTGCNSTNGAVYDQINKNRKIQSTPYSGILLNVNQPSYLSSIADSTSGHNLYDGAGGSEQVSNNIYNCETFYDEIINYNEGDTTSNQYKMQQFYKKLFEGSDEIIGDSINETYKEMKSRLERWYGPMMDYYMAYLMTHCVRLDRSDFGGYLMTCDMNKGVDVTHNLARVFTVNYNYQYVPAYPIMYNTVIYEMLSPYYEVLKKLGLSTWIYSVPEPWDMAMILRKDNFVDINNTIIRIGNGGQIPYHTILDRRMMSLFLGTTSSSANHPISYSGSSNVSLYYYSGNTANLRYLSSYAVTYYQPPMLDIVLDGYNSRGVIINNADDLKNDEDIRNDRNDMVDEETNDIMEYDMESI